MLKLLEEYDFVLPIFALEVHFPVNILIFHDKLHSQMSRHIFLEKSLGYKFIAKAVSYDEKMPLAVPSVHPRILHVALK